MRLYSTMIIGFAALLAGCDQFTAKTPPAAAPAPPTLPSSGGILAPGSLEEMGAPVSSPPPSQPQVAPAVDPAVQREVAGVGSGIKGRSLDDPTLVKPLVEPARAYFRTRERVVFEIQIPHTLNLYKASEGKAPASHEEFMEKIVEANQIKLPALPPGARYVYDPASEQLMVERPAR